MTTTRNLKTSPTTNRKVLSDTSALINSITQNKLEKLQMNGSLAAGMHKLKVPENLIKATTEVHVLAETKQAVILNQHISTNGMNLIIQVWMYDFINNKVVGKTNAENTSPEPFTFEINSPHQPFKGQRGYAGSYLIPQANRLVLAIQRDSCWEGQPGYPANANGRMTELHLIDLNNMTIALNWVTHSHGTISVDNNNLIICSDGYLEVYEDGITPLCMDMSYMSKDRFPPRKNPSLYEAMQHEMPRNLQAALLDFSYLYTLLYTISAEQLVRHRLNRPSFNQQDHLLSGCDKILKIEKNDQKDHGLETVYCRRLDGSLFMVTTPIDLYAGGRYFKSDDAKHQQITFDHHRENEKVMGIEVIEYKDVTGTESLLAETVKPKAKQDVKDIFYLYLFNTRYHEKLGKVEMSSPVLSNSLLDGTFVMKEPDGLTAFSCHQISPEEDLISILEALTNNTSIKEFFLAEQNLTPAIIASLTKLKQKRTDLIFHLPDAVVIEEAPKKSKLSIVFSPMPQIENETLPMTQEIKTEGPPGGPMLPIEEEKSSSYAEINRALPRLPSVSVRSDSKPISSEENSLEGEQKKEEDLVNSTLSNSSESEDVNKEEEEPNIHSPRSPWGCYIS